MARTRNTIPVEDRPILTIHEAMQVIRSLGRRASRAVVGKAIDQGRLRASIDDLRHDVFGRPVIVIARKDLDTWLSQTLRAYRPGMKVAI
jgi:hypothetical protein